MNKDVVKVEKFEIPACAYMSICFDILNMLNKKQFQKSKQFKALVNSIIILDLNLPYNSDVAHLTKEIYDKLKKLGYYND